MGTHPTPHHMIEKMIVNSMKEDGFAPLEAECHAACHGDERPQASVNAGRNALRELLTGFTLIETIIYITLITFMMGSAVTAAFYVIDASGRDRDKVIVTVEAEFLMHKIDWVLTGLDLSNPINVPPSGASGSTLSVNKNGFASPLVVDRSSDRVRLSAGGAPVELTAERVKVTSLTFQHIAAIPPKPAAIAVSFKMGGRDFQMTKYVRK